MGDRRSCKYSSAAAGMMQWPGAQARELKITARFSEGTIEITQFEDVEKAVAGREQPATATGTFHANPDKRGPHIEGEVAV